MTVQNFIKIVWTGFEKFEIFMKRSGERKQHDCISTRNIFPTPNIYRYILRPLPNQRLSTKTSTLNFSALSSSSASRLLRQHAQPQSSGTHTSELVHNPTLHLVLILHLYYHLTYKLHIYLVTYSPKF